LGIVQVVKPSGWLMRLLTGGKPLYQLRIAPKGTTVAKTIFNTQDARLAQRIEQAINTVAQRRGASREIRLAVPRACGWSVVVCRSWRKHDF